MYLIIAINLELFVNQTMLNIFTRNRWLWQSSKYSWKEVAVASWRAGTRRELAWFCPLLFPTIIQPTSPCSTVPCPALPPATPHWRSSVFSITVSLFHDTPSEELLLQLVLGLEINEFWCEKASNKDIKRKRGADNVTLDLYKKNTSTNFSLNKPAIILVSNILWLTRARKIWSILPTDVGCKHPHELQWDLEAVFHALYLAVRDGESWLSLVYGFWH